MEGKVMLTNCLRLLLTSLLKFYNLFICCFSNMNYIINYLLVSLNSKVSMTNYLSILLQPHHQLH